jgi:hypothetical protein
MIEILIFSDSFDLFSETLRLTCQLQVAKAIDIQSRFFKSRITQLLNAIFLFFSYSLSVQLLIERKTRNDKFKIVSHQNSLFSSKWAIDRFFFIFVIKTFHDLIIDFKKSLTYRTFSHRNDDTHSID